MDREELETQLQVLATRTQTSADPEVRAASVVLYSLLAAVLTDTTTLLATSAADFSGAMLAAAKS